MPSSYTTSGIELIGDGEQSGTWGSTTNDNLQILDRMISQAGTISLSGTTHTLTVSDGTLSDGQYAVLVFGGSPSGTNTVTITPNDAKRTYFVKNDSGESVILTQGSGGNVTVADGKTGIVYCDGAGSGAAVVDLTSLPSNVLLSSDIGSTVQAYDAGLSDIAALAVTDGNFIVGDGANWVAESGDTVLASMGVTSTATELNLLDGVTATTAELNILDGVTSTAAELNLLDGVTWTLTDYNALTATATELNLLDGLTAVSGTDTTIVTGTAGTDGQYAQWNADGDVVGVDIDTQSQATWEAGTDTTESLVSPAKVKAAVEALAVVSDSLASDGYVELSNGLIVQWGTIAGDGAAGTFVAATFPTTFPTACFTVVAGQIGSRADQYTPSVKNITTSGCEISHNTSGYDQTYIAIGY